MDIEVTEFTSEKSWDDFVAGSNNGTIFHTLNFQAYHKNGKFEFFNLAFKKKDKLIAVLPGAIKEDVFFSPAGASYGSIVTGNTSLGETENILDEAISYLQNKRIKQIKLTPPPIVYMKSMNEQMEYLLLLKGFKESNVLISHVVNLTNPLKSLVEKRIRNDVSKSERAKVIVKESDDYKSFYPLLVKNKKKFETTPTHSYEELLNVVKLFPKKIKLFMAFTKDKKPIGGIVLFLCNDTTALVFYIAQDYKFQQLKPVPYLLTEVLQWTQKNKYQWLDLGVSMDTTSTNPSEPSRSLIFFKEGVGSRGFKRSTYTLNI